MTAESLWLWYRNNGEPKSIEEILTRLAFKKIYQTAKQIFHPSINFEVSGDLVYVFPVALSESQHTYPHPNEQITFPRLFKPYPEFIVPAWISAKMACIYFPGFIRTHQALAKQSYWVQEISPINLSVLTKQEQLISPFSA